MVPRVSLFTLIPRLERFITGGSDTKVHKTDQSRSAHGNSPPWYYYWYNEKTGDMEYSMPVDDASGGEGACQ